jgi:hypothetical protein
MTWGLAACLPASGIARISNLVPHAGGHSAPNSPSNGPAVLTDELPPQGHLFKNPGRADDGHRCFLPVVREPRGCASLPVGRSRTFISLRRQPGSNTAQDFTESFGSVAPSIFGVRHVRKHEGSHDREVVNLCREFGNVCRA